MFAFVFMRLCHKPFRLSYYNLPSCILVITSANNALPTVQPHLVAVSIILRSSISIGSLNNGKFRSTIVKIIPTRIWIWEYLQTMGGAPFPLGMFLLGHRMSGLFWQGSLMLYIPEGLDQVRVWIKQTGECSSVSMRPLETAWMAWFVL